MAYRTYPLRARTDCPENEQHTKYDLAVAAHGRRLAEDLSVMPFETRNEHISSLLPVYGELVVLNAAALCFVQAVKDHRRCHREVIDTGAVSTDAKAIDVLVIP